MLGKDSAPYGLTCRQFRSSSAGVWTYQNFVVTGMGIEIQKEFRVPRIVDSFFILCTRKCFDGLEGVPPRQKDEPGFAFVNVSENPHRLVPFGSPAMVNGVSSKHLRYSSALEASVSPIHSRAIMRIPPSDGGSPVRIQTPSEASFRGFLTRARKRRSPSHTSESGGEFSTGAVSGGGQPKSSFSWLRLGQKTERTAAELCGKRVAEGCYRLRQLQTL